MACDHCEVVLPKRAEWQSKRNKGKNYCSRKCADAAKSFYGKCGHCHKDVRKPPSRAAQNLNNFCSFDCRNAFKRSKQEFPGVSRRHDEKLFKRLRKQKAVEYMGGKCCRCGYNRSLFALQFHHVDHTTKRYTVAAILASGKWETIAAELDKCIMLCANCHFEEHKANPVGWKDKKKG